MVSFVRTPFPPLCAVDTTAEVWLVTELRIHPKGHLYMNVARTFAVLNQFKITLVNLTPPSQRHQDLEYHHCHCHRAQTSEKWILRDNRVAASEKHLLPRFPPIISLWDGVTTRLLQEACMVLHVWCYKQAVARSMYGGILSAAAIIGLFCTFFRYHHPHCRTEQIHKAPQEICQ